MSCAPKLIDVNLLFLKFKLLPLRFSSNLTSIIFKPSPFLYLSLILHIFFLNTIFFVFNRQNYKNSIISIFLLQRFSNTLITYKEKLEKYNYFFIFSNISFSNLLNRMISLQLHFMKKKNYLQTKEIQ